MRASRGIVVGLCLAALLAPAGAAAQKSRKNPCTLFTIPEIQKLLGTATDAGEAGAMGTSCQWFGKDEKSYAIISIVEPSYFFDPQGAPGYEVLDGVGKRAYTHPENRGPGELGFQGMALTEHATASVVLIGTTATRAGTGALLRQLVERL